MDLGPLLPEVTVTVVDEGEDVAGRDEPEVVTVVGIEVTMVTRVGVDPIDDVVYNNLSNVENTSRPTKNWHLYSFCLHSVWWMFKL